MKRFGRGIAAGTIAVVVAALAPVAPVAADVIVPGCAPAAHDGGEWRSYGGSPQNARNQWAEDQIGPETAADVSAEWVFRAGQAATGAGGFHNTPVIADGCMYLATNTGWVFSADADKGNLNWSTHLEGHSTGLIGGVITGSVAVGNGTVYVGVSRRASPYVAALDQETGDVKWETVIDDIDSALLVSSPVLYADDDLIFQGIMGNESSRTARGGYAILDAHSGEILRKEYTIPDADYEVGYRGASIWGTAAVDPDTNLIYVGTGNPASKRLEHRNSNAIVMIDGDPGRPATFGKIVNAFKGNTDQYYPGLDRQPLCDMFGEDLVYVAWSLACLQLDLDFGASPNLFTDDHGRKLVGALQKSGVYYAVWADNMQLAWSTVVGAPAFPLNAGSTAFDDKHVFVGAQPPSQMWGLRAHDGRYSWVSPIVDGLHFQATSTANGVVYTMDVYGNLLGFDAENGLPVLRRPVSLDTGEFTTDSVNSSGIAIARNTLYVVASSNVIAYKLPQ